MDTSGTEDLFHLEPNAVQSASGNNKVTCHTAGGALPAGIDVRKPIPSGTSAPLCADYTVLLCNKNISAGIC